MEGNGSIGAVAHYCFPPTRIHPWHSAYAPRAGALLFSRPRLCCLQPQRGIEAALRVAASFHDLLEIFPDVAVEHVLVHVTGLEQFIGWSLPESAGHRNVLG